MGSHSDHQRGKVLLTGGTGFIASHVLNTLLAEGFSVVVTVRSDDKGQSLLKSLDNASRNATGFVVVKDISTDGAFDQAVQSDPPFDYVVHTASPYHVWVDDPVKDFLDPAVKGTTGILHSVKKYAPTVTRVVITSSSAAILHLSDHPPVYDESVWPQITWEDALRPLTAYKASKVFAEKAAWEFVETQKPAFDLAVINNTYTFGPIQRQLPDLEAMNTSNHRIRDMVLGKMRDALAPTAPVFTWVDVRDVALAHVRALIIPEAGGKRFYVIGGYFSNKMIAEIIRAAHQELASKLPPGDAVDDFPDDMFGFDNSRSREMLGIEYTSLKKSVEDTAESVLQFQRQIASNPGS